MSNAELRIEAAYADRRLGAEIDRLQLQDQRFRMILKRTLALEGELQRRGLT